MGLLVSSFDSIKFDINQTKLLKFILPFLIILHHLQFNYEGLNLFANFGIYVVGLFFFISGYGLESKQNGDSFDIRWCINKTIKLLFSILPYLLVYLFALYFYTNLPFGDTIKYSIIHNWSLVVPYSWFITILILFYYIFYTATRISNIVIKYFIILAFTVLIFVIVKLTGSQPALHMSNTCFLAGVIYKDFESTIHSKFGIVVNLILLGGGSFFTITKSFNITSFYFIDCKYNLMFKFKKQ